jgi:hypothetical protein
MKCPKCQFENRKNIQFCENYGANDWVIKYERELAEL